MNKKMFFENKFAEITNLDLVLVIITFISILILNGLLSYFLRKKEKSVNYKLHKYASFSSKYFVWTGGLLVICILVFRNFSTIKIYQDKHIYFTALNFIYFALVPTFAVLAGKIVDYVFLSESKIFVSQLQTKKKTLVLFKAILWIFVAEILLSAILRPGISVSNLEILKIRKVVITFQDIFIILILISVSSIFLAIVRRMIRLRVENEKIDSGTASAVFQIVKYLVWVITIVAVLQSIGLNLSILLAGSAALLVGLGMGIQNIFNDFISGLVLLIERPLKSGDIVEVDTFIGEVKHVGVRTTKVLSSDEIIIMIPNSKFTSEKIINWSNSQEETRFNISVSVSYDSDVNKVMQVLSDAALEHPLVSQVHKPFVRFEDFGDSALLFKLYFWSNENMGVENIKSDLRISINNKFRENGIIMPYPQIDVHMKNS